jgi:hypothetical protein
VEDRGRQGRARALTFDSFCQGTVRVRVRGSAKTLCEAAAAPGIGSLLPVYSASFKIHTLSLSLSLSHTHTHTHTHTDSAAGEEPGHYQGVGRPGVLLVAGGTKAGMYMYVCMYELFNQHILPHDSAYPTYIHIYMYLCVCVCLCVFVCVCV